MVKASSVPTLCASSTCILQNVFHHDFYLHQKTEPFFGMVNMQTVKKFWFNVCILLLRSEPRQFYVEIAQKLLNGQVTSLEENQPENNQV